MRLGTRSTPEGDRVLGLLDDGEAVDLAAAWPQAAGAAPASVRELLERDLLDVAREAMAAANGAVVWVPPDQLRPAVPDPRKILCVGLNYRAHADESQRDLPKAPEIFLRVARSLAGPFEPVAVPRESPQLDWEGELAVIIGRECRRVAVEDALSCVAGYAVFNDMSVRDWQHRGLQWSPGKNFDGTGPLGPALVTADEFDPAAARIETRLNGEAVQTGEARQMIFGIPELIAYCSSFTTLEPGDVIATGTPSGVGFRADPPRFLTAGDVVEVEVPGLGTIANEIIDEGSRA